MIEEKKPEAPAQGQLPLKEAENKAPESVETAATPAAVAESQQQPQVPVVEQQQASTPAEALQMQGKQLPGKNDPFAAFNAVAERIERLHGRKWFEREASFLMQIISQSDYLRKTTPASRLQAFVQLANTGLSLDPTMKLAYLIPRSVKADGGRWEWRCFMEPSYMGLIKVATDTGSVKLMRAEIVYEGDEVDIVKGTTVSVHHVPYWKTGRPKGQVIAAYSVAILFDGTTDVLDMGKEELEKVKSVSEAVKSGSKSPHDLWGEEMMRKAPIRRHLKTLPKTERMGALMHAIEADEAAFNIEGHQATRLPAAGTVTVTNPLAAAKTAVFELVGAMSDPERHVWMEANGIQSMRQATQDASKDLGWWEGRLAELKAETQQQ